MITGSFPITGVMAGLVPAIHVLVACQEEVVDARHKAGHDERSNIVFGEVDR